MGDGSGTTSRPAPAGARPAADDAGVAAAAEAAGAGRAVDIVDATLDCRGLLCPLPVYQTAAAMKRLEAGQVLRVECTDPGSLEDFPAFARQQRHALLAVEDRGDVQVFRLRKGGVR